MENKQGAVNQQYYPYTAKQGDCKKSETDVKYIPTRYSQVTPRNTAALKLALNYNALAVAIEAENSNFRAYSGGIITSGCGENLDHGVTVVGYGLDDATD